MLEQQLIAKVARSFELSLRFLPPQLREVLTLAYLLARSSDSIADCTAIDRTSSLQALQKLQDYLQQPACADPRELQAVAAETSAKLQDPHEQILVAALPQLLEQFTALEPQEMRLVQELMQSIIAGQMFDRSHFATTNRQANSSVPVILDEAQFENYTYAVAGCVGKFWSELGILKFKQHYSSLPEQQLIELGISFGKGLQQLNILRDFHEDLLRGRCYLPLEAGLVGDLHAQELQKHLQPVIDNTLQRLKHGISYSRSLGNWRLRLCCRLPAELGLATMQHMLQQNWLEHSQGKIKIGRRRVKLIAFKCLIAAIFSRGSQAERHG